MATPRIWFYPSDDGGWQEIDFGQRLTDWQEVPDERAGQSEANGDAVPARADWGGRSRLRILHSDINGMNTTGTDLAAKLYSLENHLKRGLPISVAADADHAYATFASHYTMTAGKNGISANGNLFYVYNQVNDAPTGGPDYYVLRGQNPGSRIEKVRASSWDSDSQRLAFPNAFRTLYDYLKGPVFVRHHRFFPVAYLHPNWFDRALLTSNQDRTFNFDVELVEGVGDYAALYQENSGEGTYIGGIEQGSASTLAGPLSGVYGSDGDEGDAAGTLAMAGTTTLQGLIAQGHSLKAANLENVAADMALDYRATDYIKTIY